MRKKAPTAKKSTTKAVHAIPDEALETLVRCLLPSMRSYFENVEGWRDFCMHRNKTELRKG